MRIDRLEIKNFKQFSDYTLNLHPQFTLLVGDNGTGKTTLLDALAIAAGVWLVNPPDSKLASSGRNILRNEIRLEAISVGEGTQFVECKPVQIFATGSIGEQKNIQWLRQIRDKGQRTSNVEAKDALNIISDLFEHNQTSERLLPVLAYYGAGRAWLPSNKREPKAKLGSKSLSRRWDAFYDCFEERIRLSDLQDWFQKEALAAVNRQGRMRPAYEVVKVAVLRCVPEANELWFDPDRAEIVITIKDVPTPFSNLSAGQKMMVALIADIAIKVVTQNAAFLPKSDEVNGEALPQVLQETSGLVLIDEVDVHLHPTWQRRVVNELKSTFPTIQFVCTTHSPFIIQSISQGELRSLDIEETEHIEYENRSIEDIAEDIQHVEVPQQSVKARELAEATERYFSMLQNPNEKDSRELEMAEATYRQAAESFSPNPGLSALLKLEAMVKAKEQAE